MTPRTIFFMDYLQHSYSGIVEDHSIPDGSGKDFSSFNQALLKDIEQAVTNEN